MSLSEVRYRYDVKLHSICLHLTFPLCVYIAEPLSGVLPEEDSQDSSRLGVAQGEPLKGDQDLLTCGQCHSRFPLADILLFIEHKRRQCHGTLCTDKPQDRPPSSPLASPLSTSSSHSRTHLHPRRACHPVEVAVQVSPHNEDCLSAPLPGIIPKQENITGKPQNTAGGNRCVINVIYAANCFFLKWYT